MFPNRTTTTTTSSANSKEMTEYVYTKPNKISLRIENFFKIEDYIKSLQVSHHQNNMGISYASEINNNDEQQQQQHPLIVLSSFNTDIYSDDQSISQHNNKLNSLFVILSSIIYSLIFILSIIGNLIILIVLLRRKRMRIVTNFFLANITVANLIYTIFAPFPFVVGLNDDQWVFFNFLCPILPFLSTMSVIVNTTTMIAASMERLIAIVYPFKCKLTKRKCSMIICSIWLMSILASSPWLITLRVKNSTRLIEENVTAVVSYVNLTELTGFDSSYPDASTEYHIQTEGNESSNEIIFSESSSRFQELFKEKQFTLKIVPVCIPISNDPNLVFHRVFFVFLCVIQYCLPLIVLCITYTIIAYYGYVIQGKIDLNNGNPGDNKCHNNSLGKNKNKLIKMLLLIIICFNICWMPIQVNAFIYAIYPNITEKFSEATYKYFWMCSHCLAFSHFCHNPFINGLLNKKFKSEIITLFKCGYSKSKQLFRNNCICAEKKSTNKLFLNDKNRHFSSMSNRRTELKTRSLKKQTQHLKNNNYMIKNGHIYKLVVRLNNFDTMEINANANINLTENNKENSEAALANNNNNNNNNNNKRLNRVESNKQSWINNVNSSEKRSSGIENNLYSNGSLKASKNKHNSLPFLTKSMRKSNSNSSFLRSINKYNSAFNNKLLLTRQKSVQSNSDTSRKKSTQSTATILINKFKLLKFKNRLSKSTSVKLNNHANNNYNQSSYYLTRIKRNSLINQQVLINEIKCMKNSLNKPSVNNINNTTTSGSLTANNCCASSSFKSNDLLNKRSFFRNNNYSSKYCKNKTKNLPFYKRNYYYYLKKKSASRDVLMYNWNRVNHSFLYYKQQPNNHFNQFRIGLFNNYQNCFNDSSDSSKNSDSNVFVSRPKLSSLRPSSPLYHSNDLNENLPFINYNEEETKYDCFYSANQAPTAAAAAANHNQPGLAGNSLLYNSSPNLNELAMPNIFKNKKYNFKHDFDEARNCEAASKRNSNTIYSHRQFSSSSIENLKGHNSL